MNREATYTWPGYSGTNHGLSNHYIHAGKHYKALINTGAAISLIKYSTYQLIDDCFKTPIQTTTTMLNTADGSPMKTLGMTAVLRIADFIFIHNFIICDRLPDTEIIFGIDVQKKCSLSYAWDKEKELLHTKRQQVSHIHQKLWTEDSNRNCQINAQIPPRHNGVIPNKIKGHTITGHMAYFISDQDSTKGKDVNINIINGIHHIKGKTSVNVLVSIYTNKHITYNKG